MQLHNHAPFEQLPHYTEIQNNELSCSNIWWRLGSTYDLEASLSYHFYISRLKGILFLSLLYYFYINVFEWLNWKCVLSPYTSYQFP